ncbi:MazG family protein [Curtobacterium sp. MCPF17_052]|uniref:MazG family protein n=1 Tax=Curtobacterium sp. MCPF17_052 TaxID=2175655 RepID=UPI0024DFACD2|nr:MazG family protein [Curtobacterium sp. MCPF17_052]WIB11986.1 MazG family protein [Curtobacterium sp. MCPF17_052]
MTSVDELVAVVDRLLDPEHGCVWNREQTHASLARYAVEETYELVDAIDGDDTDELREELGDVLYQVVLHAGIAAHEGRFDLDDVADTVREKMQRRHPHVFGDEEAHTVEDVVRVWRAAKAAEKAGRSSVYAGVPRAMPPLERAVKLFERLEERGELHAAVASVTDGSVVEQAGRSDAGDAGTTTQQPFGSRVDVAWGAGDARRGGGGARAGRRPGREPAGGGGAAGDGGSPGGAGAGRAGAAGAGRAGAAGTVRAGTAGAGRARTGGADAAGRGGAGVLLTRKRRTPASGRRRRQGATSSGDPARTAWAIAALAPADDRRVDQAPIGRGSG